MHYVRRKSETTERVNSVEMVVCWGRLKRGKKIPHECASECGPGP